MSRVPYYANHVCPCGHSARAHGPKTLLPTRNPVIDRSCMYCDCVTFKVASP